LNRSHSFLFEDYQECKSVFFYTNNVLQIIIVRLQDSFCLTVRFFSRLICVYFRDIVYCRKAFIFIKIAMGMIKYMKLNLAGRPVRLFSALVCVVLLLSFFSITAMAEDGEIGEVKPVPDNEISVGTSEVATATDASFNADEVAPSGNVIDIETVGAATSTGAWSFDGEDTYTINDDVTVTGDVSGSDAGRPLVFDIIGGKTVTWKANYGSGTEPFDGVFIQVTGDGVFELDGGGITLWNGSGVALKTEKDIEAIVSAGTVNAWGEDAEERCVAIKAAGSVLVTNGGEVYAESTAGCTAIDAEGDVTVDQGTVWVSDENPYGVAIQSDSAAGIFITDSKIWGHAPVLAPEANVTVGGASMVEAQGFLSFADGQLYGNAILADTVVIREDARVQARNGAAILYSGDLDISGGAVLAYGDGIGGASFTIKAGESSVIEHQLNTIFQSSSMGFEQGGEYTDSFDPSSAIRGGGIALAWDFSVFYQQYYIDEITPDYENDATLDIFAYSEEDIPYGWFGRRGPDRIWYAEHSDYFFVDISLNPGKPIKPNPKPGDNISPDDGGGTSGGGDLGGGGNPGASAASRRASGNDSGGSQSIPFNANNSIAVTSVAANNAARLAAQAAREAGAKVACATLRNPGAISLQTLLGMSQAAGMPVRLRADSLKPDGKSVDVRISLDPSTATKGIDLSASTTSNEALDTGRLFGNCFSNALMAVSLGQKGYFGQRVEIAVKLSPVLSLDNLLMYSYNKAENSYAQIKNPGAWLDGNGYLHFSTELAGEIIISQGSLQSR
jgi:hypothetical protein